MLALVESDKGNKIAALTAEIEELATTLPARLEEREKLEREIVDLENKKEKLLEDVFNSQSAYDDLEDDIQKARKQLEGLNFALTAGSDAVRDYHQKKIERDQIAEELIGYRAEEKELTESIRVKELEKRSLETGIGILRDREAKIADREADVAEDRKAAQEMMADASRKYEETAGLQKKIEEDRIRIDLSGKTMGYYIRGVQKIFDERADLRERGIKINFLELLNEIK